MLIKSEGIKFKHLYKIILGLIACSLVIFVIFNTWIFSLFNEGLMYQFGSQDYEITQKEYTKNISFDIDLQHIKNEIGKKIEIENHCFLKIQDIFLRSGQYEIIFDSYGTYHLYDGLLYTANVYTLLKNQRFSLETGGILTSDNHVKWNSSSRMPIYHRHGDSFGFSIDAQKITHKYLHMTLSNLNVIVFQRK